MNKKKFIAACVQVNADDNLNGNIKRVSELIRSAAKAGAEFITLPENAFFMGSGKETKIPKMEDHEAVVAMVKLAAGLKAWVLFGVIVDSGVKDKPYNRSVLVNPNGQIASFYDKIHLYDVSIANGETHKESSKVTPGDKAVIAELLGAKLGMTICYDLRFPHLFRQLAHSGAEIITVPSAFTYKTGVPHWHSLLRARAIENTCYVIAPGQCGWHPKERHTYGHSMIIDPWGKIIAEASEDKEEFILAEIDLSQVAKIREQLPSLKHDRVIS